MDPAEVEAVKEWPQPESRKQLQWFLGLANFYRSSGTTVASPVAFLDLKNQFTEAPILIQPDPKLQFIVEFDASDTGVGAILSRHSNSDNKLHPCASFSRV